LNISSLAAIAHAPLMGPYTTAKAGVEALTDALRMETAPSGARVGCAYFGYLDTDLVRAGFAQPSVKSLTAQLPAFMRNPAPLPKAIDAIERGIERRSARVCYPRWVGPALLLRGLIQPLSEWQTMKDSAVLEEGMRLAESSGETQSQDPVLGVSAQAIE
jgi:NAD(P)-dependent dehydrogenase (short-subunit alcohol dehydrogenase family)